MMSIKYRTAPFSKTGLRGFYSGILDIPSDPAMMTVHLI